ncbi:DNA-binding protein [Lutimonas zeaxanthinifaciens]|uniref:DNA-binding protein n=1 Tax=Lutimonas zeaxanthinifaciens TaxID=3060215 RepID=UPI00265CBD60|nr:DNA-binding protein [Lutimonas sp. YSD2104]WKK66005.1 DNA-binding protein [Lutimonas sp. YSD2104]
MNNLKQLERIKKIHNLIKLEATGTPEDLSKKLHISLRQTFSLLEQMRELEAPVKFNRKAKTYYYEREFDINITISVHVLSHDKLINIYAGRSTANFIHRVQGRCSEPNYLRIIKKRLDAVG